MYNCWTTNAAKTIIKRAFYNWWGIIIVYVKFSDWHLFIEKTDNNHTIVILTADSILNININRSWFWSNIEEVCQGVTRKKDLESRVTQVKVNN